MAAVRAAAAALRTDSVGVFPEGYTSYRLIEARPGSGTLVALLSRGRVPVLPAGVFEEGEQMVVRFGAPFLPEAGNRENRDAADAALRRRMMVAIGALLPEELRGVYAGVIASQSAI
jgi:hypothetical protein